MRRVASIVALVLIGAALVGTPANADAATKKVGVFDDFFAPEDVKIHKGDSVKWVWDEFSVEDHNVTLKRGPAGVRKFHSKDQHYPTADPYKHRFKKRGEYRLWCTLHPQSMKMTVTVKR